MEQNRNRAWGCRESERNAVRKIASKLKFKAMKL